MEKEFIEGMVHANFRNVKDLLRNMRTLDSFRIGKFKQTVDESGEIVCEAARRSFYDLLRICRTYLPSATEEELASALYELSGEGLVYNYCPNVSKWVFSFSNSSYNFRIFGLYSLQENHVGSTAPDMIDITGFSIIKLHDLLKKYTDSTRKQPRRKIKVIRLRTSIFKRRIPGNFY